MRKVIAIAFIMCCITQMQHAHDYVGNPNASSGIAVVETAPAPIYFWTMPIAIALGAGIAVCATAKYWNKKYKAQAAQQAQAVHALKAQVSDHQCQAIIAFKLLVNDASQQLLALRKTASHFIYTAPEEATRNLARLVSQRLQLLEKIHGVLGRLKNNGTEIPLLATIQSVIEAVTEVFALQLPQFEPHVSSLQTVGVRTSYNLALALTDILCLCRYSLLHIKLLAPSRNGRYSLQISSESICLETLLQRDNAMATVRTALDNVSAKIGMHEQLNGVIEIQFV